MQKRKIPPPPPLGEGAVEITPSSSSQSSPWSQSSQLSQSNKKENKIKQNKAKYV